MIRTIQAMIREFYDSKQWFENTCFQSVFSMYAWFEKEVLMIWELMFREAMIWKLMFWEVWKFMTIAEKWNVTLNSTTDT